MAHGVVSGFGFVRAAGIKKKVQNCKR